jgi:hypothetical protein
MNKSRRLFDIHNKNTFTNNKSYREINDTWVDIEMEILEYYSTKVVL